MKVIMPLVKLKVYRQWDYLRCRAKLHNMVYRRPAPIDHQIPIDISLSSSGQRFLWAVTSNFQRTTMPLPGCAVHHEGLRPCHCPIKEFRGTAQKPWSWSPSRRDVIHHSLDAGHDRVTHLYWIVIGRMLLWMFPCVLLTMLLCESYVSDISGRKKEAVHSARELKQRDPP